MFPSLRRGLFCAGLLLAGLSTAACDEDDIGDGVFVGDPGTSAQVGACDNADLKSVEERTRYEKAEVPYDETCVSETQSRICGLDGWNEWSGEFTEDTCKVTEGASCDETPHGSQETRTRYEADVVGKDGTCESEVQSRPCANGEWGEWSGEFTFETCVVDEMFGLCGETPNGGQETRERYKAERVPVDELCEGETQTRDCIDSVWGEWTGTYTFTTCESACTGDTEERTRYELSEVPFAEICESEQQTRTCTGTVWGDWDGTFVEEGCTVLPPDDCDETAHGDSETRVRYEDTTVPFGDPCVEETQARVCDNGTWGDWTGTFIATGCVPGAPPGCDGTPHGETVERSMYQTPTVPFGELCVEETQTRLCTAGKWGAWSGSLTEPACEPELPKACDGTPHGETGSRVMYQATSVPYGGTCVVEAQSRLCTNGNWSSWSGTYRAPTCVVEAAADCNGTPHLGIETRDMYESASVPYGATCSSEAQTRVCDNGTWSSWNGTFAASVCVVEPPKDCGATPHGGTETRTMFDAATVAYGQTCLSETQARVCSDGNWGAWTGTFGAAACAVDPPKDCGGTRHGALDTRTMYETATVPFGETCAPEVQTRLCTNGDFGAWSGTFGAPSCAVDGALGCDGTPHGGDETRTMYQAATVPYDGACVSEQQSRVCSNGNWGAWSGTFGAVACAVTPPRDCGATPHSGTESRTMYEAASVGFGETCVSEQQTRLCTDGSFSAWTGTFPAASCTVGDPLECDGTPHDESETRTMYEATTVPFGSLCVSEEQTRLCTNGDWGDWSGSFTATGCAVGAPQGCNGTPHGQTVSRTMYQSATAPFGGACVAETQTRLCTDGSWGGWSGTYSNATCTVDPPADCGNTKHGSTESRTMYQSATVPFGESCSSEQQERLCANGTFGNWTGTFGAASCSVDGPLDCGNTAHGVTESRVMYKSATVPFGGTCSSETQTRLCTNGDFGNWSGTYNAASCSVDAPLSCGNTAHGKTETRTMYQSSTVPYGETCSSETQTRLCTNGTFGNWSGTYNAASCSVDAPLSCGNTAHGKTESRTMYQSFTVPYGETCSSETQTRLCTNGTFGNWSGTFIAASCTVDAPLSCDGTAHGQTENRTMYQSSAVPYGETCSSEIQTRLCTNGDWGNWSGTYGAVSCTVDGPLSCGNTAHGETETRTMYQSATVPFGGQCSSEEQTRLCTNGTFGNWSGTYSAASCSADDPVDCGNTAHGDRESRQMYASSTVPYGETCSSETQTRLCTNGTFGNWSGTYSAASCSAAAPADCGNTTHGNYETRTMYRSSTVPYGGQCESEEQTRLCTNGKFSNWTGAYSAASCSVDPPLSCGNTAHGASEQRTRYKSATVPFGGQCLSETQSRLCTNGNFGAWSGTYSAASCSVDAPLDCNGTPHGQTASRTMYEATTVPFGGVCVSETQTRLCTNGTFGNWSGTFTATGCTVGAPSGCDGTPHGESETRTRFETATVPWGGQCESETQSRLCTDGTWGAWDGTFTEAACVADPPSDCGQIAHGETESRIAYKAATVPYSSQCESEGQTRLCTNGTFDTWSGTFTETSCSVDAPLDCGQTPHGETESRTMYKTSTVAYGGQCESERQTRLCTNGDWGLWSGTFAAVSCTVDAPLDCGQTAHGETETRTMYQTSSVPYGGQCASEKQSRLCTNGTFGNWSGTFTEVSCSVDDPLPCGQTPHGEAESRTMYQTSSVPFGGQCASEEQSRLCTNGSWSNWTGTYSAATCAVDDPLDCGQTAHGETEGRTMYQTSTVPYGEKCQAEAQTRLCTNGQFGSWSGSYAATTCAVDAPLDCGQTPHGQTETRTMYQTSTVPYGGKCLAETQTRLCTNGQFGIWSGSYAATSCSVDAPLDCGQTPHGQTESRTMFQTSTVPYGGECAFETQTRLCTNGQFGIWSGTYAASSCTMDDPLDCGQTAHGKTETRTMYAKSTVPFGQKCSGETQTRLCTNGDFGPWSGTYTQATCAVADPLDCDQTPHGGTQTRTMYEATTVPYGGQCVSETQTRLCTNGTWGGWTGTYTATGCTVGAPAGCDGTPHGETESRVMYESSTVPYGGQCVAETQTRLCNNGTFGSWTGTYTAPYCAADPPADCGQVPHGDTESRTMYASSTVPYGGKCVSETQTRLCTNGDFGGWSGTYAASTCAVAAPADCGQIRHGESETRVMYESASVPYGGQCVSESQSRLCINGDFGPWSGTYAEASCKAEPPANCDGLQGEVQHGDSETRIRYATSTVPYGGQCVSEKQSRLCTNGKFGSWSGEYTQTSCTVDLPADCQGGAGVVKHGTTETRVRYESSTVPYGGQCSSETQSRLCTNGSFGAWSGTYAATSCSVELPADCDGAVGMVKHGDSETRVRYADASVPYGGKCESESQSRLCTNGTFGAWSGTYAATSCSVELPADCDGSSGMVQHGDSESRTMYESATVLYGGQCVSERQSRLCTNGQFGAWSGTYTASSCSVDDPADCGNTAHGEFETRIMYLEATVPFGESCQSEKQSRLCTNGKFGSWSGQYTEQACSVTPGAYCLDGQEKVAHGNVITRIMYREASAIEICISEKQSNECYNGDWLGWTGSYKYATCTVGLGFAGSCRDTKAGTCDDYVGSGYTSLGVQKACSTTGTGVYSSDYCSQKGSVGQCVLNPKSRSQTYNRYYFPPYFDESSAAGMCVEMGGSWQGGLIITR